VLCCVAWIGGGGGCALCIVQGRQRVKGSLGSRWVEMWRAVREELRTSFPSDLRSKGAKYLGARLLQEVVDLNWQLRDAVTDWAVTLEHEIRYGTNPRAHLLLPHTASHSSSSSSSASSATSHSAAVTPHPIPPASAGGSAAAPAAAASSASAAAGASGGAAHPTASASSSAVFGGWWWQGFGGGWFGPGAHTQYHLFDLKRHLHLMLVSLTAMSIGLAKLSAPHAQPSSTLYSSASASASASERAGAGAGAGAGARRASLSTQYSSSAPTFSSSSSSAQDCDTPEEAGSAGLGAAGGMSGAVGSSAWGDERHTFLTDDMIYYQNAHASVARLVDSVSLLFESSSELHKLFQSQREAAVHRLM
jgi:hypothetical protein